MMYLASFMMFLLMVVGFFLIGLILLQRGRGGGLAGAFGGMGGQSAFGTKAGDVFTRITIGVASFWILLCAGDVVLLRYAASGVRTDTKIFKPENSENVKKADSIDDNVPAAPSQTTKTDTFGVDEKNDPGAKNHQDLKSDKQSPESAPADKQPEPETKAEQKPVEATPDATTPPDKPEPKTDGAPEQNPANPPQ